MDTKKKKNTEKNKAQKKLRLILLSLCAALLCAYPAQAMTKANKIAHRALFKQLMLSYASLDSFSQSEGLKYRYLDVDNDKTDELIIYPGFGFYSQGIYDYRKGETREVCVSSQGTFTRYNKKKRTITVLNSGHMGGLCDYYYKLQSGKYRLMAWCSKDYNGNTPSGGIDYSLPPVKTTYYVNDRQTTKDAYKLFVRRMTRGKNYRFPAKWKTFRK